MATVISCVASRNKVPPDTPKWPGLPQIFRDCLSETQFRSVPPGRPSGVLLGFSLPYWPATARVGQFYPGQSSTARHALRGKSFKSVPRFWIRFSKAREQRTRRGVGLLQPFAHRGHAGPARPEGSSVRFEARTARPALRGKSFKSVPRFWIRFSKARGQRTGKKWVNSVAEMRKHFPSTGRGARAARAQFRPVGVEAANKTPCGCARLRGHILPIGSPPIGKNCRGRLKNVLISSRATP